MNEKFIDDNVLKHVGSVISVGSLMYLERQKELLKDKNYNCAYKILRCSRQICRYIWRSVILKQKIGHTVSDFVLVMNWLCQCYDDLRQL